LTSGRPRDERPVFWGEMGPAILRPAGTIDARNADCLMSFGAERTAMAVLSRPIASEHRASAWVAVVATAAIGLLPAAYFVTQNETVAGWSIAGYRVVDNRTIVVTVVVPPGSWTRVARVVETPLAVRVTVDTMPLPHLGTPSGGPVVEEVPVVLSSDLGPRTVADGAGVAMQERDTDR
jgi:hypothetical protein